MNGNMLNEIKELVEQKKLDTDAALRLMLKSQGETVEAIGCMQKDRDIAKEERQELVNDVTEIKDDIKKLNDKLDEHVFENPVVKLGKFIKGNPKLASFMFMAILILMNLWFVSGFRRAILLLFHVPMEIVDAIAP